MNQQTIQVSLVAAVVGAAVAGVTAIALRPPASGTTTAVAAPGDAAAPRPVDALMAEVQTLAVENRELRARIEALEGRPMADARTTVEPDAARVAAAVAAERSEASASNLPPAEFQERVAAAIEAIRTQERAAAAREREERELQRVEERLTEMIERLALSPGQVKDMRAFMLSERDARAELERLREQGADREAYRLAREEQHKREVAELTRILSPDQYKTLQERDNRGGGNNSNRGRGQGGGRGG